MFNEWNENENNDDISIGKLHDKIRQVLIFGDVINIINGRINKWNGYAAIDRVYGN